MDTITTEVDIDLRPWTDQVITVARFIADHDLTVIGLSANDSPRGDQDGAHVQIHVSEPDWTPWSYAIDASDVVDTHDELYMDGKTIFHYVVANLAGVRVQICYLTSAAAAVA
jgi:hypothetical protein